MLIIGFVISSILHFRWDSFAIHLNNINNRGFEKNKILFVGDSITAEGTRPRGFITKLESLLKTETKVICAKGATTMQITSQFESNTHDFKPSHVIVQSGINDLINGLSEQELANYQFSLVERIRTTFPTAIVLFIPPHPFFFKRQHFIHSNHLALNVNSHSWWDDANTFAENYLINDGIHLNAQGHTLLARKIAQKLTK